MASDDDHFFPAVFVASVGRERGYSEERISEAFGKLKTALSKLEARPGRTRRPGSRGHRASIAHAGNFVRLRELEGRGEISLSDYPNRRAWMERLEDRESYEVAV